MTGLPADKNFELPQMLADELPGWVRLDALYRALNDAYHPQNPTAAHPADFVERWASESEHWSGGSGEAPAGLSEQQVDAFIAALPGVRVIVRERNPRYFNGPPGRYVDPPIPMHIDHDLTRQEIREALAAALRGPVGGEAGQEGGTDGG